MAYVFYKAGFIESWGRGWQKICDGFQAAGLPKPTIESTQGGVLVTFQRNNVNLSKPNSAEVQDVAVNVADGIVVKVAENIVESIVEKLSTMRGRIVKIVWKNPYASAQSISEVVGISTTERTGASAQTSNTRHYPTHWSRQRRPLGNCW